MTLKRIEKFQKEEEEKANRYDLKKAEKLFTDEKKWQKEVIGKLDLVPDNPFYYDKLAVKPGFDFFYAIINSPPDMLSWLRINLPEILYFNYNSYFIKSDNDGKITFTISPKSQDFLESIESKAKYDIVRFWTEPATVMRSATGNPCYTNI